MARSEWIGRRGLLAATAAMAAAAVLAPVGAVAAPAGPALVVPQDARQAAVVRALDRVAQPLRTTEPGGRTADLRALDGMIGDATVVGLGEATHGSHEFFAMKERLFRHLVEEQGFTTFALETSWSGGLLIDEFLQGGRGDARRIVAEVLGGSPWEREEFVSLLTWMREYNRSHPQRPVHFLGDDLGAPRLGDRIFERVVSYVRGVRPEALPELDGLYAGLRPFDDVFSYLRRPVAERRTNATRAQAALDLVTASGTPGEEGHEWAVQHARNIAQTFAFASFDLADRATVAVAEQLRDRAMAENVTWWQRRTGGKVLLSAHNGHVGYLATDTFLYPKPQGSHLRDALGRDYVAIGFTFDRGSFLTNDEVLGGGWKSVTVPPATPEKTEHTLDLVRHRDYYVDLRTAPRAARDWLNTARPTYEAGSVFVTDPVPTLAVGQAYDVLIHLNEVHAARKL